MLDKVSQIIITSKMDKILVIIFIVGMLLSFIISKLIDKSNNSAFKIRYIKFFLGTGFTLTVISIILDFYLKKIYNIQDNELLVTCSLLIFGIILGIHGVFLMMFGNIKPPKPDKFLLKQDNYLDFSNYLSKRVNLFNYEEKYTSDRLKIYYRVIKKKRYYMIDTKLEELTEENFNELYDKEIFPIIEQDFNQAKKSMRYELFITFIISVDRMSPVFNRFVNTLDQDKRYYKLPIGVSFGGNKMYIPNEIEGFGLMQFNRLKKEFKKIMEIEEKR